MKKFKDETDLLKKRIVFIEKEKKDDLKRLSDEYERQSNEIRNESRLKLDKCENEKLKSISDLEKELVKQRERTMKLLEEKSSEIDELKGFNNQNFKQSPKKQLNSRSNSLNSNLNEQPNEEHEDNTTTIQIPSANLPSIGMDSNRLMHYIQESAYKEIELNKLRSAKSDLEYKLKQTCDEHSVDIDRLQAQISILKQEIERLKLNYTRNELNGSNLEYIKNVVFNYMTTKDQNVRLNMQDAITQILQFTKIEKQKLVSLSSVKSLI